MSGVSKAVRAELDRLYEQHGVLREEDVVAASKPKRSPLHHMFLWDDQAAAAHLGRLEIARGLIRRVVIEEREMEKLHCTVEVRKYQGVGDGGGYRDIKSILTQKDLREMLLARALDDLSRAKGRYAQLKQLAGVWAAVDKVPDPRKKKGRGKK